MKPDAKTGWARKENVILHACCAPCAAHVIDILSVTYNVSVLFYNPNIYPEAEFNKRYDAVYKLCSVKGSELIVFENSPGQWFEAVKGFEDEPEGGRRCRLCIEMRLKTSAEVALKRKTEQFATTLTISPHKNMETIHAVGRSVATEYGLNFLDTDFRKDDGFRKSCLQSRQLGLYRQRYCGCMFSMT